MNEFDNITKNWRPNSNKKHFYGLSERHVLVSQQASGKVPHLSVAIHSYARIYSLKSAPSEQTQTNQAFTAASTRELRQEAARPHVEVFDGLSPQKKERLRGKQL